MPHHITLCTSHARTPAPRSFSSSPYLTPQTSFLLSTPVTKIYSVRLNASEHVAHDFWISMCKLSLAVDIDTFMEVWAECRLEFLFFFLADTPSIWTCGLGGDSKIVYGPLSAIHSYSVQTIQTFLLAERLIQCESLIVLSILDANYPQTSITISATFRPYCQFLPHWLRSQTISCPRQYEKKTKSCQPHRELGRSSYCRVVSNFGLLAMP